MEGLEHYYKEERPWGSFERFTENEATTVKILHVKAGEEFSLQTHEHRNEFWRVLSGSGKVTVGEATTVVDGPHDFFVPHGVAHRIEATGNDLYVLEIAFGKFDESDITRLDDKYGRS